LPAPDTPCYLQEPLDEFICLLFEIINSTNEKHFMELAAKAQAGEISKEDFVRGIDGIEFMAMKRTRDLLRGIKFAKTDTANSYNYKRLSETPDNFDDFLLYRKKVSPHRDARKEYEAKYDFLRKR